MLYLAEKSVSWLSNFISSVIPFLFLLTLPYISVYFHGTDLLKDQIYKKHLLVTIKYEVLEAIDPDHPQRSPLSFSNSWARISSGMFQQLQFTCLARISTQGTFRARNAKMATVFPAFLLRLKSMLTCLNMMAATSYRPKRSAKWRGVQQLEID